MKPFTKITVGFLAVVAVLHTTRIMAGWVVTLNGMVLPVWLSGVAALVAGSLAFMVWRENR